MKWSNDDHGYMAHAIQLARQGQYSCQPNPRVGCVIVQDDKIVGEGSHIQSGKEHAEIIALVQAGSKLVNATCYVTLEPCVHTGKTPPCTDSLIKSGITKIIAAMVDPNPKVNGQGLTNLEQNGVSVQSGLLEVEARKLNKGYIQRMTRNMPYVRCKLAMSIDGKTALASGNSKWITGEKARHDVQKLRAISCAVMTGIGTILSDDPMLNVREINTLERQPVRVIIDRTLKIPINANILLQPGKVIIFTTSDDKKRITSLEKTGVVVKRFERNPEFLTACLSYLTNEDEINEVLVEAGAGLSGAMLEAGLIDELVLYQAPIILGDKAIDLFNISKLQNMNDKYLLALNDIRHLGNDVRLTYILKN
ncbi:MAG: bifunctional diaminohydroxyphosphoribosylaminopyrimidine deaminase/5-amino-6-(5-phosphoribosylamino)uracil reductase RibD [Gammaproteobacteria bacterium]